MVAAQEGAPRGPQRGPGTARAAGRVFNPLRRRGGAPKAEQRCAGQRPAPGAVGLLRHPAAHRRGQGLLVLAAVQGLQHGFELALALARPEEPRLQLRGAAGGHDHAGQRLSL